LQGVRPPAFAPESALHPIPEACAHPTIALPSAHKTQAAGGEQAALLPHLRCQSARQMIVGGAMQWRTHHRSVAGGYGVMLADSP
jgi:hypothetical protein